MAGWLPAPSPGAGGSTPDLADWPDPEEAPSWASVAHAGHPSRFAEQWFNLCVGTRQLQESYRAGSAGLQVEVSSGNVGPMAVEAIAALGERGLVLDPATLAMPRQVVEGDLELADAVVAVDAEAHRPMVQTRFPQWETRIRFWDVKDLGEGSADPITQLQQRVEALLDELVAGAVPPI